VSITAFADHRTTEQFTLDVMWMTTGLGCDGDTVALTSATNPQLRPARLFARTTEREPDWRDPAPRLTTGYAPRW
jgi:hypothetical protein